MSRLVSFLVLVAVIVVAAFFFYRVMASFILPLFLAVLATVIFQPVFRWLIRKLNQRRRLAALATTAFILLVVLLPICGILVLAAVEGSHLVAEMDAATLRAKIAKLRSRVTVFYMPDASQFRAVEETLTQVVDASAQSGGDQPARPPRIDVLLSRLRDLGSTARATQASSRQYDELVAMLEGLQASDAPQPNTFEYEGTIQAAAARYRQLKIEVLGGPFLAWIKELANPSDADIRKFSAQIFAGARGWLFRIGSETSAFVVRFVIGLVIMTVSIYFFLVDGPEMVATTMRLSPLDNRYEAVLLTEFESISRAVVVASLLSAAVQGFLGGIGYWLAGLQAVFLLTVLTTVLAMVPFVGTAVVWLPASLWLYFYEERSGAALCLALYGGLVVSMADNLIKPWVLHGQSKLHPLLALLSVLGGVKALGPIGIVVGPMAVVFLQTLLNLLHRELTAMEGEPSPIAETMPSTAEPLVSPGATADTAGNTPGDRPPQATTAGAPTAKETPAAPKTTKPKRSGSKSKRRRK